MLMFWYLCASVLHVYKNMVGVRVGECRIYHYVVSGSPFVSQFNSMTATEENWECVYYISWQYIVHIQQLVWQLYWHNKNIAWQTGQATTTCVVACTPNCDARQAAEMSNKEFVSIPPPPTKKIFPEDQAQTLRTSRTGRWCWCWTAWRWWPPRTRRRCWQRRRERGSASSCPSSWRLRRAGAAGSRSWRPLWEVPHWKIRQGTVVKCAKFRWQIKMRQISLANHPRKI